MDFPAGCLGKLPLHGDFIRCNAAGNEINELDRWIQEGTYEGHSRLGPSWDREFDAAPQARFIYCSPRTRGIVAGLFKPSVDRAGRRYPFLLYAVLEPGAMGAEIGFLPNAMGPFLAKAQEMLEHSGEAPLGAFQSALQALRFVPDVARARTDFARFVLVNSAADYWSTCFGAADDTRRFAAVASVAQGAAGQALAMRLPFQGQDSEAAFWLELGRRLTGGKGLPSLVHWNPAHGSAPGRLHLAWGELSPRYFLSFVLPGGERGEVRDLSAGDGADPRWVEHGSARFRDILNNTSLKLTDLLQRIPRS